jgi:hypothetical protein
MVLVKGDEKGRQYRDRMDALSAFVAGSELPKPLAIAMKEHLGLQFAQQHSSDDQVTGDHSCVARALDVMGSHTDSIPGKTTRLRFEHQVLAEYPSMLRIKALRHLYGGCFQQSPLFSNIRGRFMDQLLNGCRSETFMPDVRRAFLPLMDDVSSDDRQRLHRS